MNEHQPYPADETSDLFGVDVSYEAERSQGFEPVAAFVAPKVRIVIIDQKSLFRECLARCLRSSNHYDIATFPSVEAWMAATPKIAPSIILLALPPAEMSGGSDRLDRFRLLWTKTPTIVLSDDDNSENIKNVLNCGVRGFLSTTLTFEIANQAIRLVLAGGTFVPPSILTKPRQSTNISSDYGGILTNREVAIVGGLRQGKTNKIIAFELGVSESTVKVHLRNIMQKMSATNRTQVAVLVNAMASNGYRAPKAGTAPLSLSLTKSESLDCPKNVAIPQTASEALS